MKHSSVKKRYAYKILVGNHEGKGIFVRQKDTGSETNRTEELITITWP
jgi:hypothetical protein